MDRLDGEGLRRWVRLATIALGEHRARIDSLNVFPVADSDTGTNVYLTIAEGAQQVLELPGDATTAQVARSLARGTLVGARGNSGVILSQFLNGFAGSLARSTAGSPLGGAGPLDVAKALQAGHKDARAAVSRPVEGTVLTAADRAARRALSRAERGANLDETVIAALRGARKATRKSPKQLPVLAAAGVVDAGASALVVILEALVIVVTGRPAPRDKHAPAAPTPRLDLPATCDLEVVDGEFEVMFLVEADMDEDIGPRLRARLQALGESVAVVGGGGTWQAHVHTDHPALAIERGALGDQRQIVVRHLLLHGHGPTAAATTERLGVVAGISEPGLVAEVARTGAVVHVLTSPPVTPAELARAVTDTGARHVVVLPGDAGTHRAATALAARIADLRSGPRRPGGSGLSSEAPTQRLEVVEAIGGIAIVAALAVLVVHEGGTDALVARMRVAVERVRTARVPRSALASADGGTVALDAAVGALLSDGAETLTVLRGAGVPDALIGHLVDEVSRRGAIELVVLDGEQDEPALALGAE